MLVRSRRDRTMGSSILASLSEAGGNDSRHPMNGPLPPHSLDDADRRNATHIFAIAIPNPSSTGVGTRIFSDLYGFIKLISQDESRFGNAGFRAGTASLSFAHARLEHLLLTSRDR